MIERFIAAVKEGLSQDIEQMLRDDPELIQAIHPSGETPLITAIYYGKRDIVQQLLTYGVPVSLYEAVALGDLETVTYLIEHDAPLDEYSYDGWTPLHLAAFFGSYEVAELLIQRGASVNAVSTNNQRNLPIHAAAAGRKYPLVKLLLEHGAEVNAQQAEGWTPLLLAVNNFDLEMSKLLKDYKADPHLANDDGQTPLNLAKEKHYEHIMLMLESDDYDIM